MRWIWKTNPHILAETDFFVNRVFSTKDSHLCHNGKAQAKILVIFESVFAESFEYISGTVVNIFRFCGYNYTELLTLGGDGFSTTDC